MRFKFLLPLVAACLGAGTGLSQSAGGLLMPGDVIGATPTVVHPGSFAPGLAIDGRTPITSAEIFAAQSADTQNGPGGPAADAAAADATFTVRFAGPVGSATCIESKPGRSVLLTNYHVVAGGPHIRVAFPKRGVVSGGGKSYPFTAVSGDMVRDVAFLVVEAELPAARLADADPPPGAAVWHKGFGSGSVQWGTRHARTGSGCESFASTLRSVPGDSGAGIFDRSGRLVAVNCGLFADALSLQRGTAVSEIRAAMAACLSGRQPGQPTGGMVRQVVEQTVSDGRGGTYTRTITRTVPADR